MTKAARQLLDMSEALSRSDQQEVVIEILRRLGEQGYSSPDDEEFLRLADRAFLERDCHDEDE
jgi:hypothetical protein